MGTLSYTVTISVDGYAADANGEFDWSAPTDEVFQAHIDRMFDVSAEVLGRKTYQLMTYWERDDESWGEAEWKFARRWRDIDHIVASSTLAPSDLVSKRARLVPQLSLAELEQIVRNAPKEVEIFGPTTAAPAIRAGMVNDFRFFVVPKIVGGGLRAIPSDVRLDLRLAEQRTFGNGAVYLHYTSPGYCVSK